MALQFVYDDQDVLFLDLLHNICNNVKTRLGDTTEDDFWLELAKGFARLIGRSIPVNVLKAYAKQHRRNYQSYLHMIQFQHGDPIFLGHPFIPDLLYAQILVGIFSTRKNLVFDDGESAGSSRSRPKVQDKKILNEKIADDLNLLQGVGPNNVNVQEIAAFKDVLNTDKGDLLKTMFSNKYLDCEKLDFIQELIP